MDKPIINILWTGGMDSTFRVCQLSFEEVTIQPYYILEERLSTEREINAIKKITAALIKRESTKCTLNPIKYVKRDSLKEDNSIAKAWESLSRRFNLGSQYEYLSRCANQIGERLEVCVENSHRSKACRTLKEVGVLQTYSYISINQRITPPHAQKIA